MGQIALDRAACDDRLRVVAFQTQNAERQGEYYQGLAPFVRASCRAPDDLTKLAGIGPQLEKKINEAGIFHYWQLAAMSPDDVAKLDTDMKIHGRIARDRWVENARAQLDAA